METERYEQHHPDMMRQQDYVLHILKRQEHRPLRMRHAIPLRQQRVYDQTGFETEPGLMRVILSYATSTVYDGQAKSPYFIFRQNFKLKSPRGCQLSSLQSYPPWNSSQALQSSTRTFRTPLMNQLQFQRHRRRWEKRQQPLIRNSMQPYPGRIHR